MKINKVGRIVLSTKTIEKIKAQPPNKGGRNCSFFRVKLGKLITKTQTSIASVNLITSKPIETSTE